MMHFSLVRPSPTPVYDLGFTEITTDISLAKYNISTKQGYNFSTLKLFGRDMFEYKGEEKYRDCIEWDELQHIHVGYDAPAEHGMFDYADQPNCCQDEYVTILEYNPYQVIKTLNLEGGDNNATMESLLRERGLKLIFFGNGKIFKRTYLQNGRQWEVYLSYPIDEAYAAEHPEPDYGEVKVMAYTKIDDGHYVEIRLHHIDNPRPYIDYIPGKYDKYTAALQEMECIISTFRTLPY